MIATIKIFTCSNISKKLKKMYMPFEQNFQQLPRNLLEGTLFAV